MATAGSSLTCTPSGLFAVDGKLLELPPAKLWAIIAAAFYAANNGSEGTGAQIIATNSCQCVNTDQQLLIMAAASAYQFALNNGYITSDPEDLVGCLQCTDEQTLKALALKGLCTWLSTYRTPT